MRACVRAKACVGIDGKKSMVAIATAVCTVGPHNTPLDVPDGADSKKFSPVTISLVNKPTFVRVALCFVCCCCWALACLLAHCGCRLPPVLFVRLSMHCMLIRVYRSLAPACGFCFSFFFFRADHQNFHLPRRRTHRSWRVV